MKPIASSQAQLGESDPNFKIPEYLHILVKLYLLTVNNSDKKE
jgi:hypothetical protein